MTAEIDRFREDFERLLAEGDLLDFDALMTYDGYFDELPLYATYADISFLGELPLMERNRVLVRAAVEHLGRIYEHAERFYAGREFDFFCAVTVTGWEYLPEGDPLTPRFWRANPSRGVFEHLRLRPPGSEGSNIVAHLLGHDSGFLLNDDIVDGRLERVFVQLPGHPLPPGTIEA
ncbi:Imm15 family immunity protein [Amycolatopsis lurida]